ncbi:hypothetical protein [Glycomyces sp. YM15]|uniref:hypothetical protein n=1 Tax=Glycomyces sp. YM15 TaxID=2800446 RepID=UPI001965955D|nr:hypothetical protein [Glycomyces sp. YM15]
MDAKALILHAALGDPVLDLGELVADGAAVVDDLVEALRLGDGVGSGFDAAGGRLLFGGAGADREQAADDGERGEGAAGFESHLACSFRQGLRIRLIRAPLRGGCPRGTTPSV